MGARKNRTEFKVLINKSLLYGNFNYRAFCSSSLRPGCAPFSLFHRHSLLDWRAPDCSKHKRWNHSTVKRSLSPRCGVITAETFVRTSFHHFDFFHHWSWFSDQTLQTERYIFLSQQPPPNAARLRFEWTFVPKSRPRPSIGKEKIIYFSKFGTFCCCCFVWYERGANNNRNNIFHILYSIST